MRNWTTVLRGPRLSSRPARGPVLVRVLGLAQRLVRGCRRGGARSRNERGSISVWLAASSFVMIVLVGLAVDLAGQVHTQQQARNIAAQAARTGAQEIQAGSAVRGGISQVDISAARAAASSYLAYAGVSGTVNVQGGDTLVVQVSDTYDSRFLSIINLDTMRVTGEASARMIRTEGGVEE